LSCGKDARVIVKGSAAVLLRALLEPEAFETEGDTEYLGVFLLV
jgi:hypothetical protein